MQENRPQFPEPVPTGTQLAALPFLSAIEGFLGASSNGRNFRVTMHRIMAREQHRYIQQICEYVGPGVDPTLQSAGRLFPQGTGLMGKTIEEQRVFRTKHYSSLYDLKQDLKFDLSDTGSKKAIEETAVSYLTIPFVGADGQTVLVLYADSFQFNHFADDVLVENAVSMCRGFGRFLDWLTKDEPLENLRNFLTPEKQFKPGKQTAYNRLQEVFDTDVPTLSALKSFNFEVTST